MIKKEIKIELAKGLEARPVAVFVQVASQFDSSIFVEYRDKRVNAKSIMGMMSLGIAQGEKVVMQRPSHSRQGTDLFRWRRMR